MVRVQSKIKKKEKRSKQQQQQQQQKDGGRESDRCHGCFELDKSLATSRCY